MKNPSALKVVDLGPAEAHPDVPPPNALPEIEEHVRLLGMVTPDLIWAWDLRTRKVVRHPTFVEVLGESPLNHPASMEWWKSRVHPDDLPGVIEIYDRALADGSDEFSCEYRLRDRSGTYLIVEDRAQFLRDLNGEVIRIFGAVRNITKRQASRGGAGATDPDRRSDHGFRRHGDRGRRTAFRQCCGTQDDRPRARRTAPLAPLEDSSRVGE